jgi:FkbM family methyltransferase
MTLTSYSILREDILLARALSGVSHLDGFYIDVGANDPDHDSVTRLFYEHGWRGMNIEPSPHWFSKYAGSRPRDINIHAAASDTSGTLTLFDHTDGGLGTIVEEFADRHVGDFNIAKRGVEVQAVTLTSLCEQHAPADIHFLKIDVEGHEEQAIRGMNFKKFRPWILCIEATEPMRPGNLTHHAWDHLIVSEDYWFALFDGLNRWYVAKEHPERMRALVNPTDDYVHHRYLRRIQDLERRVADLEREASAG